MTETLQFTSTELKIIDVLDNVAKYAYRDEMQLRDGDWTILIKQRLAVLGEELKYKTCASFKDSPHCEWLYDLVWFKNNEENRLESVPLVVESEWKMDIGSIRYDFEKLLVANSECRLMICQTKNKFDDYKAYFYNAVKDYKALKTGERFLIAILDYHILGAFKYELIVKE